jgi:hypothetical protein
MNPPFSTALHVETRVADAAFRHLTSAVARLAEPGRLVAITGASCAPDHKTWRDGFVRLQDKARVVFTATISGNVFTPHGTSVETRLTVIDKVPADDPAQFPASFGLAPDLVTLLRRIRPSSCNRRRWPRSRRPSRATAACCPPNHPTDLLSDAQLETVIYAGEAHCRSSRRDPGRSTRPSTSSRPRRRCRERRALPPRLHARRRHRRRQGPPGRRHHPRQLAERAAARRSGSPNPTS